MKYFVNIENLNDLKKAYHKLCMQHHPDRGGSIEIMQAINEEYDKLFEMLKNKQNATADERHQTRETPEQFKDILNILLHLDGLEVEICGAWLWIGGNTFPYREILKENKCYWSKSKHKWYWNGESINYHTRGTATLKQIRQKYGSTILQQETPIKRIQ